MNEVMVVLERLEEARMTAAERLDLAFSRLEPLPDAVVAIHRLDDTVSNLTDRLTAAELLLNLGYVTIQIPVMFQRMLPHLRLRWYRDAFVLPCVLSLLATIGSLAFVG